LIISITTIPTRINFLKSCIKSLENQGFPVYVWLPRYVERLDDGFSEIPGFLSNVNAEIVEDMGPATKLIPALERFETVITADDDSLYSNDWAKGLAEWSEKLPNAGLGYRGRIFHKSMKYSKSKLIASPSQPREVDIITSNHGTLYKRYFFSDDIFTLWRDCYYNDDILFGSYLRNRGIPMYVVPRSCSITTTRAQRIDPLFAPGTCQRNDKLIERFYKCS